MRHRWWWQGCWQSVVMTMEEGGGGGGEGGRGRGREGGGVRREAEMKKCREGEERQRWVLGRTGRRRGHRGKARVRRWCACRWFQD